jgi:formyltetrahydrofolate-dependent phosphoribosylglycinamide formyltransferase
MSPRGALFLDRDGTLVVDMHYPGDPDRVALMPGAAAAVRAANAAGVPVVVVTNQSGIARGYITAAQYGAVAQRLEALLAAEGARLDATFHCPHWPEVSGPCDCRKPGTGMYRAAAAALGLDLARSACVGDRWRDVAPALELGGLGVLVPGRDTPADDVERARDVGPPRVRIAGSLDDAVREALAFITAAPAALPARIAVLASGGGTNLQALLDHFADGTAGGRVVWVGSNVAGAGALARAGRAGVATGLVVDPADGAALLAQLRAADADLVALAGYLRLVPAEVVRAFPGRIVNVHPALLPAFGGPGMYGRHVHEAVLAHGCRVSGVTVHLVDEQYDRGPILAQWPVPVLPDDDAAALAARVLQAEHALFPRVVEALARGQLALGADGRVATRDPAAWSRLLCPFTLP